MAGRIIRMRRELFQALQDVGAPGNWTPVMDAIGMFAMLGLTKVRGCACGVTALQHTPWVSCLPEVGCALGLCSG